MKKVVFACDGKNFSHRAFDFIKSLNEAEKILVAGIFFLSVDYRILVPSVYADPDPLLELVEDETENVKASIKFFEESCAKNGIEYRLHNGFTTWNVVELVKETRFSDLLILSEELFFKNWGATQPNHFMRQVMQIAECPVLVIPENFETIEKLLIAYDGKRQSLFALKLFSLLFANMSSLPTNIVFIQEDKREDIPDLEYLQEYASRHYPNLSIQKLHIDFSKNFSKWVGYVKNALLITGAYGRPAISNLFKESFAEKLIRDHNVPLFIAHNS
jgi:hypothetical protein